MALQTSIDSKNIPQHLAIIMDGNGRWAKKQGLLRTLGHQKGSSSVREVITGCIKLGIPYLTLYAFSTEHWNRPKFEVDMLMRLLLQSLEKEYEALAKHEIRLNVIGEWDDLPSLVRKRLQHVMTQTQHHTKLTLTLAISYGSRKELVKSVTQIAQKIKNNVISPQEITQTLLQEHLYTHDLPDVDLLIRTSGEQRISNFLLWQIAYAELYFTQVLWPDFTQEHLYQAIEDYQKRERRFGKTSEQLNK